MTMAWNDDVKWILGRPNFSVARLAKKLHEVCPLYADMEHKAEDEQAVALHWMLDLYLCHGAEWRKAADEFWDRVKDAKTVE